MSCTQCELHKTCKTVKINPSGNGDIVFLGEAPGAEEDREGVPFIGKSGELLRTIAADMKGVDPARFRFTNAVRCRPVDNKTPTKKQVRACLNHLLEEFIENPPSVIVPLGNTALEALRLTGLLSIPGTIMNLNGKAIPGEEVTVFPILHPSYILRNPAALELYVNTFNGLQDTIVNGIKAPEAVGYDFSDQIEDLEKAIAAAKAAGLVAYDIETSVLHPKEKNGTVVPRIISFSLSWQERQAFGFAINEENLLEAIRLIHDELLENHEVVKVIQHAKFELMWSAHYGRTIINIEDTMLLHWHVNEKNGTHGLGKLAANYTDMGFYDAELENYKKEHKEADPGYEVLNKETGEITRGSYANIPMEILLPYNCCDTDATLRVRNLLKAQLDEKQLAIHDSIQIPACYPLAEMEYEGVTIDWDYCSWMLEEIESEVAAITAQVFAFDEVKEVDAYFKESRKGKGLSLSSPQDLRVLLFESLKMPVLYNTDGGAPSTDKTVLDFLADRHEVPNLLRKIRRLNTLKGTFVVGAMERRRGNRIHTSYGMAHTETGRYNSSNPNLQNIPRDPYELERDGEKIQLSIKQMYVPDSEGDWICQADYSQVELRVAAIQSGDETLLQYFRGGVDVHRYVAARIHSVPPDRITKEQRTMAKRTVFGLIYGQSPQGLAEELHIPLQEAQEFLHRFFVEFPKVKAWMDMTEKRASKTGVVESLFGRKRRLPDAMLKRVEDKYRAHAMRQAINAPIQSSAADILAKKKGELWLALKEAELRSRILLTVHDQMLFNVPEAEAATFLSLAKDVMEDFSREPWAVIPIAADFEIGRRWGELYKLEAEHFAALSQGVSIQDIYDALAASKA